MPTLIIHVDQIKPNAGYKKGKESTEPVVKLKLRKPHMMIMQKEIGEFITKPSASEKYEEKKSFEVDDLKGLELGVEVYDTKLAELSVSASVTGAKALGNTNKILLGSCKVKLDNHGITADPKGVKLPLSNTFNNSGAEIYLIFTLNP